MQYLKRENLPLPIRPIPRNGGAGDSDKLVRASAASTYLKCGYVTYVAGSTWWPNFSHEMTAFPTGAHDDQVDCLTDLVQREIVPNGTYLPDMDVAEIPVGDTTYVSPTGISATSISGK